MEVDKTLLDHEHRIRAVERQSKDRHEENVEQHKVILTEVKAIRGILQPADGEDGIVTRVKVLEVDQMHARRNSEATTKGQWGLIAALVASGLALVGSSIAGCSQVIASWPLSP